jgi:hypothetical protein
LGSIEITGSIIERNFIIESQVGKIFKKIDSGKRRNHLELVGWVKPGNRANGGGYYMVSVHFGHKKYKQVRLHHLIWVWETGKWPIGEIDHINGDRNDNRFENLREASISQNRTNRLIQSNNKCGYKWVYWDNKRNLWRAEVIAPKAMKTGRKRVHQSFHTTAEKAYESVCNTARKFHGDFFNDGKMVGG